MFEFGSIVCVAFPFTNLSATKLRPALVISRRNEDRTDLVLAFITSRPTAENIPDAMRIAPSQDNGLRTVSYVRFDKLVTLDKELTGHPRTGRSKLAAICKVSVPRGIRILISA